MHAVLHVATVSACLYSYYLADLYCIVCVQSCMVVYSIAYSLQAFASSSTVMAPLRLYDPVLQSPQLALLLLPKDERLMYMCACASEEF
jgi:hypothetical protein